MILIVTIVVGLAASVLMAGRWPEIDLSFLSFIGMLMGAAAGVIYGLARAAWRGWYP